MPPTQLARLIRHPRTPCAAVRGIDARVIRSGETLALTFVVEGDLSRLRLPPPCPPRFAPDLWRHTCLEAFLAADGATAYHEYNFAPSGEWALYAFEDYRTGGPLDDGAPAPEIVFRGTPERVELEVVIRPGRLSPAYRGAGLSLGLSAVIEQDDGALSYWALCHAGDKPDFHLAASRTLQLAPAIGE